MSQNSGRVINMKLPEALAFCAVALLLLFGLFFYYRLPGESPQTDLELAEAIDADEVFVEQVEALNLLKHLKELYRIKRSVLQQLRDAERRYAQVMQNLDDCLKDTEACRGEQVHCNNSVEYMKRSMKFLEMNQQELLRLRSPRVLRPLPPSPPEPPRVFVALSVPQERCTMDACVDYSSCSRMVDLHVFVDVDFSKACQENGFSLSENLRASDYLTSDAAVACLFILPVCSMHDLLNVESSENWNGDGRNHVLVVVDDLTIPPNITFGRALIAGTFVPQLRRDFDMLVPPVSSSEFDSATELDELPLMVPARRTFLLHHSAFFNGENHSLSAMDQEVVRVLSDQKRQSSSNPQSFLSFGCPDESIQAVDNCSENTWCWCGSPENIGHNLGNSTYALVIPTSPQEPSAVTSILLALKYGAIPVILGPLILPFDENIDWLKCVVRNPKALATELLLTLQSIRDEDLLSYRRNGRSVWQAYFSSRQKVADTLLDTVRVRLGIPAKSVKDVPAPSVFNETYQPLWQPVPPSNLEETMGAVEPPYPSDVFQRNLTAVTLDKYEAWNVRFDAGVMHPHSPFSPVFPGDAKFRGSEFGFRPIGGGAGGSGMEFSEALGGNRPREQFTVVILTYQRETILSASLARLNNLAHLNRVIVVWNSPLDPSETLILPKIHVPIHIYKSPLNSLNNRFLPFGVIETEAVLSMDDDIQLRHDEINFAFRVWRENRDRIVGFPARYHAWDTRYSTWLYNSNYTCEFSMVLTGASFFHKYYLYQYTYTMPASIREKVDEYMNCEDIAMNFLVAHLTRKPPIKVTSRWTFRCQDCPISLWEDESHFTERHVCMQYFEKVYGYMPLLNSQFRADSVLFKTRIPSDKQKCYKII